MPIKQSTDIRYNAPKHLEERYNITKVSEASAYQYPDGAIHYFTEDCTDYPKGLYKYNGTKWEQLDLGGGESGCIVKYTTVKAAVDSGEDFKEGSLLFNLTECTVGDVTYHYRSLCMYNASKEWIPVAPSVDYFSTLNFVYQFMMEGEVGERTIKTFTIEDLLGEEDSTKTVDELIAEGKLDADGNILNMPSFIDARTIIPRYTTLLEYWRDAAIYWEYFDGVFTSRKERKRFVLGTDQLILGSSTCYQTNNGIRIKALTIKGNEDTNKVSCLPMQNRTPDSFNIQIAPRNNSGLGFANDRTIIRNSLGNEILALLPGNNRYNTGSLVEEVTDIEGALDCDIPSVGAIRKLIDGGSITPGEGGNPGGGSEDVVDMSDFVKGERRGGGISFSYDHSRTPLPNNLEHKTYGELEEMGLIRSDGCLLLSACYYGDATMEELGYFVNHVEFKYVGAFFVAYAKDEQWVISTRSIDSIVLLSRNTCFMGYDVPPYYYGYEISYDVDEEEWVATEVTVENGCPCRVPFKAVMGNEEVTLELPSPQTKVFHLAPDGRFDDYYNFDNYADQLPTVGTVKYMLKQNNNGSGDGGLTSEQRELLESLKNEDGTNRLDTIEESIDPSIPARVQSIEQWKGTLNILSVEREAEGEWVINVLAQQ